MADLLHNFSFPATYKNERISRILNIWNRKCMSGSWRRKTGLTPFDRKCMNMYRWNFYNFICQAIFEIIRISHILNIWNRKCRSRSRSTISAMMSFDGKCQNLQPSLFTFVYVYANESNTHTQTQKHTHKNRQAHSYRQNLADLTKNFNHNAENYCTVLTNSVNSFIIAMVTSCFLIKFIFINVFFWNFLSNNH